MVSVEASWSGQFPESSGLMATLILVCRAELAQDEIHSYKHVAIKLDGV